MPTSQVKKIRRKEGKKRATSTTAPPSLKKNQGSAGLKNSESSTSNWSTTGEGQVRIGCIPVKPKLSRRFYEALVLLAVLGQNRGDRIDEESFESEDDPSGLDITKEEIKRQPLLWNKRRRVSLTGLLRINVLGLHQAPKIRRKCSWRMSLKALRVYRVVVYRRLSRTCSKSQFCSVLGGSPFTANV
jgi:hypothetical protein